jgi:hypothetical protein
MIRSRRPRDEGAPETQIVLTPEAGLPIIRITPTF